MHAYAQLLTLHRVAILQDGAFGVLLWQGVPFAVSLERTYEQCLPKMPVGAHQCIRSRFNKGGYDTFEVVVLGHSRILFHKGNVETDSDGCVLVGEQFGVLKGKPAILQSGVAFKELMLLTANYDAFDLTVI